MPEYQSSNDGEMYTLSYVDDCDYIELAPAEQFICKRERASPYPIEKPKRRPGRAPARRDSELDEKERDRLNRRRDRNRQAAARCRERRMQKIDDLEGQVSDLKTAKQQLVSEQEQLQKEIKQLRFQLNLQVAKPEPIYETPAVSDDEMFPAIKQLESLPVGTPKGTTVLFTPGGTFSLTPFSAATTVFNFPVVQADVKNTDSVSEFTKTLAVL